MPHPTTRHLLLLGQVCIHESLLRVRNSSYSIRSAENLPEIWKDVKVQGVKMQLWCDEFKTGQCEEQIQKKKKKSQKMTILRKSR